MIDTSTTNLIVPPLDRERRAVWRRRMSDYEAGADLDPLFAWIEANYEPKVLIGPGPAWIVYVPTASAAPAPSKAGASCIWAWRQAGGHALGRSQVPMTSSPFATIQVLWLRSLARTDKRRDEPSRGACW